MKKLLLFLILIILFFHPILLNKYISDGDLYDAYIPMFQFIRNSYYHFELPLISKSISCGYPVYRDSSMGIYYPLNLLFLIPINIFLLTHLIIFLHLLILALGAYKLMNLFSQNKYKSLVFSIISVFSAYTISHIGHYPIFAGICFVPFYFYFIKKSLIKYSRNNIIFSILSLLIILLTGHPQIFLYTSIFSILYFINSKFSFKIHIIIFAFVILLSMILVLPMFFMSFHNVRTLSTVYFLMQIKLLLTSIFPNIHYSFSNIFPLKYNGPFIVNEVSFYSSLLILFLITNHIFFVRKYNYKLIFVFIVLFLLSFIPIGGFYVFNTPVRLFGFVYLILIFSLIHMWDFSIRKKTLFLSSSIFISISILMLLNNFQYKSIIFPALYFSFYAFLFIISKFIKTRIYLSLLILLVFTDLMYANFSIINWTTKDNAIQKTIECVKDKRTITYEPKNIGFYYKYLQQFFNNDNITSLRSYSSAGNRGIYYNSISYNISITLTYKEYIDFFEDSTLLNSGFSNIDFIFNTDNISYDYIFVPDMPIILSIDKNLIFPFIEDLQDTVIVLYSGNLFFNNSIIDSNLYYDNYLENIKNLKSKKIIIDSIFDIDGKGTIYMMKNNTGHIIHFPYLFENSYFTLINKSPYFLFKKIHRNKNEEIIYILNPSTGKLIKKDELKFVPIDLILGFIIFMIGVILLIFYKKEKIL